MLTVAVLGPVTLRRDGAELALPAGRTTELLVRLAVDAGSPVRAERLIEDLWPDRPGPFAVAPNTLQSKVSALRRALGERELLRGGALGYTLDVAPAAVDALVVARLADEAETLLAAGEPAAAVAVGSRALAMFSGQVLPGAGDGSWVEPHRARLDAVRMRLREARLVGRVRLGGGADVIAELESAVREHPLQEGLWQLLITALYRAGRQADALAAHRRVRRLLAAEVGLDPGPGLQELERQVLGQDGALMLHRRVTSPAPGNLPPIASSLVGRERELAHLARMLGRARLLTLTGPAGVGKTRLAIELAARSAPPGGAWLTRLEPARGTAAFWQVLGEAFGLSEAVEATVLERLHGEELLLVLDNGEHLVEHLAGPLGAILAVPGASAIVTSQLPLDLDGEQVFALDPLPVAASVELFAQRAAQRSRTFVLDARTEEVVRTVVLALDGLPLAIELAAARVKALSVQEIARRLDDRFALLNDPGGRRPARHRTLAAAIGWSYDLLLPDDRRGLWALACFAGGAPLGAVERVLAALDVPAPSAVDVLDRLVDRSLVTAVMEPDGAVRYRLLDSVRRFSLERLAESGLEGAARAAHAAWFADRADQARGGARGPDQPRHLALVRVERANIDVALGWTASDDPATGSRIALGFGWCWAMLGAGAEGARRVRVALAADPTATRQDRAEACFVASWLEAAGGDLAAAAADVESGLALARGPQQAVGQVFLAFVRTQQGRTAEVVELVAGARTELAGQGARWEEAASWLLSAWALTALGRTADAAVACAEALHRLTALGDRWALIHADALLGGLAQAGGRFAEAIRHHARAARAADELGFAAAVAVHLANLGRAEHQAGDLAAAAATLSRAVDAGIATGDLRVTALARVRLGRVLRAAGEPEQARLVLGAASGWYARAGGGEGQRLADQLLAALQGDLERLRAVLSESRRAADTEVEVLTLDAIAAALTRQGRHEEGGAVLARADALHQQVRHLVTDGDRFDAAQVRGEF